jgi:hypothetical protein
MSQSESLILSDDEYCGVEPMRRVTPPPSRAPSITPTTEAERNRIIRRKKRTIDDRLDELTDYNKKLDNINEVVLLLHKALLLLSNHETFNEDY